MSNKPTDMESMTLTCLVGIYDLLMVIAEKQSPEAARSMYDLHGRGDFLMPLLSTKTEETDEQGS